MIPVRQMSVRPSPNVVSFHEMTGEGTVASCVLRPASCVLRPAFCALCDGVVCPGHFPHAAGVRGMDLPAPDMRRGCSGRLP
ncbi:hypothetical protein [Novacetimonas hansenii]|nr:hypothetical protein [Novacetimonas hansenii]